jgi:hypothetical protein
MKCNSTSNLEASYGGDQGLAKCLMEVAACENHFLFPNTASRSYLFLHQFFTDSQGLGLVLIA